MRKLSVLCGAVALMLSLEVGFSESGQSNKGKEAPSKMASHQIRQLTQGSMNHDLDNNQNFTRDGKWLIYDTRNPGIDKSLKVEKVHIETGETVTLYAAREGAEGEVNGAGAASFSPLDDRVAFIHGPWKKTGLPYDFTRRRGGMVSGDKGGAFAFADARDITPPFTAGALRGGTHRHEWDGSGTRLGYTYNDQIMKDRGMDLRTIGVTHLGHRVVVPNADAMLFEGDGEGFSALVVSVVAEPKPGTEEISRAAQDSWVGNHGYRKADGTRQLARAFVGSLRAKDGSNLDELFIVDIPEDLTVPGNGPIEGTLEAFPAPPKGCSQRRLTWTEKTAHPGVFGTAWSSPDGEWITFLAFDRNGEKQIFGIHPEGGEPLALTSVRGGVAASPRWSPDGNKLASITASGEILVAELKFDGETKPPKAELSFHPAAPQGKAKPINPVWSPDAKAIAFNQMVEEDGKESLQVFVLNLCE